MPELTVAASRSEPTARCRHTRGSTRNESRRAPLLCFVALLVLACSGCRTPDEQIEEAVQLSMQNALDTVPQYARCHLKVTRVQVTYQTDNLYQGTATITSKGSAYSVPLLVTYDGDNVAWQTSAGALSFALE